jgi:hypothetical protein
MPWKLLSITSATFVLGSAMTCQADVPFRVKNCSDTKIEYETYNGSDGLESIPFEDGALGAKNSVSDDANYRKLVCHTGQFCKLRMEPNGFEDQPKKVIKVQAHHYMRIAEVKEGVRRFEDIWGNVSNLSSPIIVYTISDKEEHCKDHLNDPKEAKR